MALKIDRQGHRKKFHPFQTFVSRALCLVCLNVDAHCPVIFLSESRLRSDFHLIRFLTKQRPCLFGKRIIPAYKTIWKSNRNDDNSHDSFINFQTDKKPNWSIISNLFPTIFVLFPIDNLHTFGIFQTPEDLMLCEKKIIKEALSFFVFQKQ